MAADFADEVQRLASGVGRDADVDDALPCIVDDELCRSYLRLLPPQEMHGMTIRI